MISDAPPAPVEHRLRAPWWLDIMLFVLISAKAIEVVVTLSNLTVLDALPLPFSPIVRVIFAGYWLVTLIVCTVGLWHQARWVFRWTVPVITFYALTHVLWQVLFFRSDFDRGRLAFQIVISILLVLPLWAIAWQRGWLSRATPTQSLGSS
jgi:hypothetical protein